MDTAPKAPKPLTEAQRSEVRNLLKQLSAASASRRSRSGNRNPLSRKKIKKVKRIENPFDSIDEGKTVNLSELSPDCVCLPFVQRVRIVLMPYIYDHLSKPREEWIEMIVHYCGCLVSETDGGTHSHVRFVVEGNAPIRFLHVYFEEDQKDKTLMLISNFMFAT
jgi:hypothetical protein|tara:strand:- start:3132 stop:3623 length:492 start_codon:yes stop_codon:yes gene_type:complete